MLKAERTVLEQMREFIHPEDAFIWLVDKGMIDLKRCRIWAMRRHYYTLIDNGISKMDALTMTAEEYCVAETTVQEAIYKNKDI